MIELLIVVLTGLYGAIAYRVMGRLLAPSTRAIIALLGPMLLFAVVSLAGGALANIAVGQVPVIAVVLPIGGLTCLLATLSVLRERA